VAHTCNPSYSGGRDQENLAGLKPARANSSVRPYLEKPFTKIELVERLKVQDPVPKKKNFFLKASRGASLMFFHCSTVLKLLSARLWVVGGD
jgi:hypothetical protein